jgi:hypothetical protein
MFAAAQVSQGNTFQSAFHGYDMVLEFGRRHKSGRFGHPLCKLPGVKASLK